MPKVSNPQDRLYHAVEVFSGVVDLLCDAQMAPDGFGITTASSLHAVLSYIRDDLEPASMEVLDFPPGK